MRSRHTRLIVLVLLGAALSFLMESGATASEAGPALPGETAPGSANRKAPRITPEPGFGSDARSETAPPVLPPSSAHSVDSATQPAVTETSPGQPRPDFRIGYFPDSSGDGLDEALARRFALALDEDRDLTRALRAAGYSGKTTAQPADGFNDLLNRLNHEEFNLSFCPAAVFTDIGQGYSVILQQTHAKGIIDSHGGGQMFRQGVLFVGPSSPLFGVDKATTASLRETLRHEELAVPSAYDAAGYFYPCLALARMGASPSRFRFCGSSQEVVKQVVSGMADIGACDLAALDEWLATEVPDVPLEKLVYVLRVDIAHVPTDPVIVREKFDPQVSEAGRALRDAVKRFFSEREGAHFRLEESRGEEFYDRLRADLARLGQIRGTGGR